MDMEIQQNTNRKVSSIIVTIAVVILILCLPLLMTPRHGTLTLESYLLFSISLVAYLIVFFANYYILIKRLLFKKKWVYFLIANVVLIAAVSIVLNIWNNYYFTNFINPLQHGPRRGGPPSFWVFVGKDAIFMAFIASLAVGLKMTFQWYQSERERSKMEAVASQAELKNLKSQLNPHFLFNTLNNIYSLMTVDQEKAQNAILGLSKILRYVLYDDSQEKVLLEKELVFTLNYVDLMSLRMTDNVTLTVDIPKDDSGAMIAPLVFISLVENAFKHGISPDKPSFVNISIVRENYTVKCVVSNSYFPKDEDDKSGSGIGLDNLKRRLQLIYPARHIFVYGQKGDIYVSELSINLQ